MKNLVESKSIINKQINSKGLSNTKENHSLNNIDWSKNRISIEINKIFLLISNGLLIWYKSKKPIVALEMTHIVDDDCKLILNTIESIIIRIILITIVNAAGNALLITLVKKFPLTILWFGSKASTKEGIPIVTVLVKVSWIGING